MERLRKAEWIHYANSELDMYIKFVNEQIFHKDFLKIRSQFPGLTIRYSTDGSIPNNKSREYETPVQVFKDSLIVIRSFDSQGRGGRSIKLIK